MARRYQPKHAKKSPARTGAAAAKPARRNPSAASGPLAAQPSSPGATRTTPTRESGRARVAVSPPDPVVIRTTRRRRGRALVRTPSPYPVGEETAARPAWWMRVRGLIGAGMLVTVGGVLAALAVGIVLVLLVIAAVATLA